MLPEVELTTTPQMTTATVGRPRGKGKGTSRGGKRTSNKWTWQCMFFSLLISMDFLCENLHSYKCLGIHIKLSNLSFVLTKQVLMTSNI